MTLAGRSNEGQTTVQSVCVCVCVCVSTCVYVSVCAFVRGGVYVSVCAWLAYVYVVCVYVWSCVCHQSKHTSTHPTIPHIPTHCYTSADMVAKRQSHRTSPW